MGTLILLCFSVLLTYAQRLDAQQQIKMEAFRKAMQKAWERNAGVSYTLKKDTRFYNLMGGFGEGQGSSISSTASVMWVKGMSGPSSSDDEPSFAFYEINNQMIGDPVTGLPRQDKTVIGFDGDKQEDTNIPVNVWKEDVKKIVDYSSTTQKQEVEGGTITNTKSSNLQETVETAIYTRFDNSESDARYVPSDPEYVLPSYSYSTYGTATQGAYYNDATNRTEYNPVNVGTVINKERSWETDYQYE